MAIYSTTTVLYDSLQVLFARVETKDPQAAEAMLQSKLMIRFQTTAPQGTVLIDARKRPLAISFGTNGAKPDVDIQLSADTLHQILLGDLTITKALGRRALVASGPIWKTKALGDIFHQARQVYPQVLAEQGLG